MTTTRRRKSEKYPGVFWREVERRDKEGTERVYYIYYRPSGVAGASQKQIEEKVGRSSEGMTEAKANMERAARIAGKSLSNAARRKQEEKERLARQEEEAKALTVGRLWDIYLEDHDQNRSIKEDINRYKCHIAPVFADALAADVDVPEITGLRRNLEKKKLSPQTVKHCLAVS